MDTRNCIYAVVTITDSVIVTIAVTTVVTTSEISAIALHSLFGAPSSIRPAGINRDPKLLHICYMHESNGRVSSFTCMS
jgi:hypothetical protein